MTAPDWAALTVAVIAAAAHVVVWRIYTGDPHTEARKEAQ